MRRPLRDRRSRVWWAVTFAVALSLLGIEAPVADHLPGISVASAAELSTSSYVELRDRLLGPSPEDPVAAARQLVGQVLGPDETVAQVATIELLRQAGIPTINFDGAIVAMPSDILIGNGPMIGDYLAGLTRSVRAGDYYTIQEVADIFVDSEAATAEIPPDLLLAGIAEWGKFPDAPRESVIAGTAVRELGARRGEPLFVGLDPLDTRVDLLQFTLLYLHLVGDAMQVDTSASAPTGLIGPAAARAAEDCRSLYDRLQLKPAANASLGEKIGVEAFKKQFWDWLALRGEKAAEAVGEAKSAMRAVDIASKAANLIVFLTSIQLKVEADKYKTHFRHEPGDTSHDVSVVATAEWQQGETAQELRCLQGIVGIDTQANGPMPGLLVRWRLDEPQDSARNGKLLRPKAGQAKQFDPTLSGGQTTDEQGQSRVILEPAVERQPGQGALLKGDVTVYANLDKANVPDVIKAFLGNKTLITDYMKKEATNWPKFLFDQLYDISLKAIQRAGMPVRKIHVAVDYHGADAYAIQGVRHPYLFFYSTMIDINAYTCDGLNGRWHGNVAFTANKSLLTIFEQVLPGTNLPNSPTMTGTIDAILDLRGRSDVLTLAEPFRLKVSVDQSLIDRGQYGNVGEAGVTIESTSLEPYMFFDPTPDLPVIRLNKANQSDIDELCPNSGSYFP